MSSSEVSIAIPSDWTGRFLSEDYQRFEAESPLGGSGFWIGRNGAILLTENFTDYVRQTQLELASLFGNEGVLAETRVAGIPAWRLEITEDFVGYYQTHVYY